MEQNELMHYGVLGMKWGVRHNPKKAYTKSSSKLHKLDSKYKKAQGKADDSAARAERKAGSFFASKESVRSAINTANKKQSRANNIAFKASKWFKRMEKEFSKTKVVSLSKEDIAIGKRYCEQVRRNTLSRYNSQYNSMLTDPGNNRMFEKYEDYN